MKGNPIWLEVDPRSNFVRLGANITLENSGRKARAKAKRVAGAGTQQEVQLEFRHSVSSSDPASTSRSLNRVLCKRGSDEVMK